MILVFLIRFVGLTQGNCQDLNRKIFQPYGPKMCELLCQDVSRSTTHMFDQVQLICRLDLKSAGLNLSGNAFSRQLGVTLSDVNGEQTSQETDIKTRSPVMNGTKTSHFTKKFGKTRKKRRPVCPKAMVDRLFGACNSGELDVVKRVLYRRSMNVNCTDNIGITAVMIAASCDRNKIFDFLVKQKCDLSAVDIRNQTVLHYACNGRSYYSVKKLLNDHSLNIESRDWGGQSPLMVAVVTNNVKIARLLVNIGADIKTKDDRSNTLLHVACTINPEWHPYEMVSFLLLQEIPGINSQGSCGITPLLNAVEASTLRVVKLLMKRGADVNTVDCKNNNIIHYVCRSSNTKKVKYILSLNISDVDCRGYLAKTPLMFAVEKGNTQIVKLLMKRGADIKTVDHDSNTILHWACFGGHLNMIRYVYSLNVNSLETIGVSGRTPVMLAAQQGHLKAVKFLIKRYKAKITTTDDDGMTILHITCQAGQLDMVEYLVTLDGVRAMREKKNKAGETPLDLATKNNNFEIVSYLS